MRLKEGLRKFPEPPGVFIIGESQIDQHTVQIRKGAVRVECLAHLVKLQIGLAPKVLAHGRAMLLLIQPLRRPCWSRFLTMPRKMQKRQAIQSRVRSTLLQMPWKTLGQINGESCQHDAWHLILDRI